MTSSQYASIVNKIFVRPTHSGFPLHYLSIETNIRLKLFIYCFHFYIFFLFEVANLARTMVSLVDYNNSKTLFIVLIFDCV